MMNATMALEKSWWDCWDCAWVCFNLYERERAESTNLELYLFSFRHPPCLTRRRCRSCYCSSMKQIEEPDQTIVTTQVGRHHPQPFRREVDPSLVHEDIQKLRGYLLLLFLRRNLSPRCPKPPRLGGVSCRYPGVSRWCLSSFASISLWPRTPWGSQRLYTCPSYSTDLWSQSQRFAPPHWPSAPACSGHGPRAQRASINSTPACRLLHSSSRALYCTRLIFWLYCWGNLNLKAYLSSCSQSGSPRSTFQRPTCPSSFTGDLVDARAIKVAHLFVV